MTAISVNRKRQAFLFVVGVVIVICFMIVFRCRVHTQGRHSSGQPLSGSKLPRVSNNDRQRSNEGPTKFDHSVGAQSDPSAAAKRLTPAETVALALVAAVEGPGQNELRWSHPGAKEQVFQILEDDKLVASHGSAMGVLGHIAENNDVPRLKAWLEQRTGVLSVDEKWAVECLFVAVGIMSRDGKSAATEWMSQMAVVEYWVPPKFSWHAGASGPFHLPQYDTLYLVIRGYAVSEAPGLEARVRDILESARQRGAYERYKERFNISVLRRYANAMLGKFQ